MPNWIRNSLMVDKDFNRIKEYCASDKSPLDFQKILPCPPELENTESRFPYLPEQITNFEKTGYHDWYDWCVKNWGTKWLARDVGVLENGFSFFTAWDPPWGIIGNLMQQFPEVTFTLNARDDPCNGYWEIVVRNDQIISGSLDR